MNRHVQYEYHRLRAKGWNAQQALRAAKIRDAFDDKENEGLVRVVCEPEVECIDTFEPDFQGLFSRDCDRERAKKEWYAHVDRHGIWMYATQFRRTEDDAWQTADSIGGVDGDWTDSGYDTDLMQSALDALDASYQDEADEIASRPTQASVGAP